MTTSQTDAMGDLEQYGPSELPCITTQGMGFYAFILANHWMQIAPKKDA